MRFSHSRKPKPRHTNFPNMTATELLKQAIVAEQAKQSKAEPWHTAPETGTTSGSPDDDSDDDLEPSVGDDDSDDDSAEESDDDDDSAADLLRKALIGADRRAERQTTKSIAVSTVSHSEAVGLLKKGLGA